MPPFLSCPVSAVPDEITGRLISSARFRLLVAFSRMSGARPTWLTGSNVSHKAERHRVSSNPKQVRPSAETDRGIDSCEKGWAMTVAPAFHASVLWFLPTHGDGHYLGTTLGARPVTLPYLRQIAQAADDLGYYGALLPTGRSCEDPWVIASALAPLTERLRFLVAVRPGLSSEAATEVAAATTDKYLTWGEPPAQVAEKIVPVAALAAARGRNVSLRHSPACHRTRDQCGRLERRRRSDPTRQR